MWLTTWASIPLLRCFRRVSCGLVGAYRLVRPWCTSRCWSQKLHAQFLWALIDVRLDKSLIKDPSKDQQLAAWQWRQFSREYFDILNYSPILAFGIRAQPMVGESCWDHRCVSSLIVLRDSPRSNQHRLTCKSILCTIKQGRQDPKHIFVLKSECRLTCCNESRVRYASRTPLSALIFLSELCLRTL